MNGFELLNPIAQSPCYSFHTHHDPQCYSFGRHNANTNAANSVRCVYRVSVEASVLVHTIEKVLQKNRLGQKVVTAEGLAFSLLSWLFRIWIRDQTCNTHSH